MRFHSQLAICGFASVLSVMASESRAAVAVSKLPDATSFAGSPAINTAGSAAATLGTTFSVGLSVAAGASNRFGQSFTTGASPITLDSISVYMNGQGGSNGVGIHLYQGFSGGAEADVFVNPNNPTPSDLLGGGSGLSINVPAATGNGFLVLAFSGADQVVLAANTKYYFEFSGGDASLNVLRAGSSPYAGGNAYAGTDPASSRGLPSSGSVRDSALAVYAAVPEPASLGLLGLAGVACLGRKRRA